MCVISTQFAPQEPKKTNRPPFGKGKCRRFRRASCASPRRFLLWSWSIAGVRRGRHQIMEWRRAGRKHDAIYPHHSRTSLVRPPPSRSYPTLDRTVSLSIVSAILERESNQEARSGERGREEQSSGRCSSLCPSAPPFPVARRRHHLSVLPALNQTLLSRPGMYTTRRALQPPPSACAPPASIL